MTSLHSTPVNSAADILAVLAKELKPDTPALVRDAIIAFLVEVFRTYQVAADYAAAQSDELRAIDIYLKGIAKDNGLEASPIDTDATLRNRLLTSPDLVTPTDILAIANAIVGQYSTTLPKYFELPLDGTFVTTGWDLFPPFGNGRFSAFIGTTNTAPTYQDRLYDNANNISGIVYGTVFHVCPQRDPLRARVNADTNGRFFWLSIPDLSGTDDQHIFSSNENGVGTVVSDFFVFDGSNAGGNEAAGTTDAFSFQGRLISVDVYNAIATAVQIAKGQGIRWTLFVDPDM